MRGGQVVGRPRSRCEVDRRPNEVRAVANSSREVRKRAVQFFGALVSIVLLGSITAERLPVINCQISRL